MLNDNSRLNNMVFQKYKICHNYNTIGHFLKIINVDRWVNINYKKCRNIIAPIFFNMDLLSLAYKFKNSKTILIRVSIPMRQHFQKKLSTK